jgi:hypothetical protein
MPTELKAFTVNMKSLDQDIDDPIIAGAGDANGRTFRVIFTQEAAAQFTEYTKVYLSWKHKQAKVEGLQVFNKISDDPMIWEIKWPRTLLYEGDALCCIKLVDDISITQSTNFIVHILSDPTTGENYVTSDDYSIFQTAVINMNYISEKMVHLMEDQEKEFEGMKSEFSQIKEDVESAKTKADAAYNMAKDALDQVVSKDAATGVYMNEIQEI